MKKGFGIFFIIAGLSNFVRVFAMMSYGATHSGGQSIGGILSFGIGFIGLGIWMISSSKKAKDNIPPEK